MRFLVLLVSLAALAIAQCPAPVPVQGNSFAISTVTFGDDTSTPGNVLATIVTPWEDPTEVTNNIVSFGTSSSCSWTFSDSSSGSQQTVDTGVTVSYTTVGCITTVSISLPLNYWLDNCFTESSTEPNTPSQGDTTTIWSAAVSYERDYTIVAADISAPRTVISYYTFSISIATTLTATTASPIEIVGLPTGSSSDVVLDTIAFTGGQNWVLTFTAATSYPFIYYVQDYSGVSDGTQTSDTVVVSSPSTTATSFGQFSQQTITVTLPSSVTCSDFTGGDMTFTNLFYYDCISRSGTDCPFTSNPTTDSDFFTEHPDYQLLSWSFDVVAQNLGSACPTTTSTSIQPPTFAIQTTQPDYSTPQTTWFVGDNIYFTILAAPQGNDPAPTSLTFASLAALGVSYDNVPTGSSTYAPVSGVQVTTCPNLVADPSNEAVCFYLPGTQLPHQPSDGASDQWQFETTLYVGYSKKRSSIQVFSTPPSPIVSVVSNASAPTTNTSSPSNNPTMASNPTGTVPINSSPTANGTPTGGSESGPSSNDVGSGLAPSAVVPLAVGIVVAGVVIIAIIVGILLFVRYRKNRQQQNQ